MRSQTRCSHLTTIHDGLRLSTSDRNRCGPHDSKHKTTMKHEKPGITFLSFACLATRPQPAADESVVGNERREAFACVDPDALSRFEGEGGSEASEPDTELTDVPLENAIWRRPVRSANQPKTTL